jgi:preprotein translocase subunit SecA
LEPLQEQAEKMIAELELEKIRLEHVQSKIRKVLEEHITMQVVETLIEKSAQEKKQVDELAKELQEFERSVQVAHIA